MLNGADALAAPERTAPPTFFTVKERWLVLPTVTGGKSRLRGETAIAGPVRLVLTAAAGVWTGMADERSFVVVGAADCATANQAPIDCVATRMPHSRFFILMCLWSSDILTDKCSILVPAVKDANSAHYGGESTEVRKATPTRL